MKSFLAVAVFIGAVLAALAFYKDQVALFANSEGFKPSLLQKVMTGGLLAIAVTSLGLFVFALDTVERDYKAFLAHNRAGSAPPPTNDQQSTRARTEAAYQARGFSQSSDDIGDEDGPALWIGPVSPDTSGIYRRQGALVYEDGHATQFSVAVIYAHDVWSLGDELNVDRAGSRKPVSVRTAINRPIIRELVQANDYVLTIGLASSAARDQDRNDLLAHARAWNLGIAVLKLKLKEPTRIIGISRGHAMAAPSYAALEPRQRAVVLVGVNASRDVSLRDVIDAAAAIIMVDGVDLKQYSTSARFRALRETDDYLRVNQIAAGSPTGQGWVLPAVPQRGR